jgi:hypothetical protein
LRHDLPSTKRSWDRLPESPRLSTGRGVRRARARTGLLLPQYYDLVFKYAFVPFLGEVAIMLWLLIKGAKPQPLDAAASSPAAG